MHRNGHQTRGMLDSARDRFGSCLREQSSDSRRRRQFDGAEAATGAIGPIRVTRSAIKLSRAAHLYLRRQAEAIEPMSFSRARSRRPNESVARWIIDSAGLVSRRRRALTEDGHESRIARWRLCSPPTRARSPGTLGNRRPAGGRRQSVRRSRKPTNLDPRRRRLARCTGATPAPTAPRHPSCTVSSAVPGDRQMDLGTTSFRNQIAKGLYTCLGRIRSRDLVGRPVNTLLDEVLAPVDPEVFERQLEYYETLYGKSAEE